MQPQLKMARQNWLDAQARLQAATAALETLVAADARPEELAAAQESLGLLRSEVDFLLTRYVTQLAKS